MTEAPRTACAHLLPDVIVALTGSRFDLATEASIQRDIERVFLADFGAEGYAREFRLSARDRVDFLVAGCIAVEVKHRRAKAAPTLRQLARYAEHPDVTAIILATGCPMVLPGELNGKPVHQIGLGRAWL